MPPIGKTPFAWPVRKYNLFVLGTVRVGMFCKANDLPVPTINNVPKSEWVVNACAYYRPDTERMRRWAKTGINVCLDLCGSPCGEERNRNWTWPGSVTDREPYGVLCHELGHHVDWLTGERKWGYGSEYCEQVKDESGEAGITSYADENPAEWFAESFRLFITNHGLLKVLRPKTHSILLRKFKPVGSSDWRRVLGTNVPDRIIQTLTNKGAV